jgi:E3 ubiquitin-protein ligase SHPRH
MSILQQWKTEIRNHAPGIKVKIYDGIKSESIKTGNSEIVSQLLGYDIVLTTYDVLAGEVYYTGVSPERSLRHARKYEWQRSPLVQIDWWRVVLDECQMVESGVSNAAKVAQLIPRQNAWAVSGTPLRNSANDLFGLLIFLRLHPYCNTVQGWISLVTNFKPVFKDLFGAITLRHTKEQVMDDIKLPPHMRKVSTIPFTQIEEEYYSTLFQQMCAECGLNTDGAPLTDTWDPQSSITIDKMRAWLSRLRQSCLHPEVGVRNRRALGRGDAPLRTVPEVLQVMIDQNDTVARTEERALLMSKLRRGQILEHARRSQEALEIWLTVLAQSQTIVVDCRQDVASEEVAVIMPESSQAQSDDAITRRMGMLRLRLRSALEVEHVSTFFVANAYFQLKSDGEVVTPGSDRFKDLEKLEIESYERAKLLRNEILTEAHSKAHALISSIRSPAKGKAFVTIPNMSLENKIGGIESREVLENLEGLSTYLNEQAGQLDEWREKMIELLLLPLVDQEENDLQGDEYETSTKQQDEGYAYIEALRAVVADRHNILSGQNNLLIEKEMGTLLQRAVNDEGHAPELMRTLLRRRIELKPRHQLGSLRSATAELRRMQIALRGQAGGGLRTTTELKIVTDALQTLLLDTKKQSKAITALERELECFRETSNARLEYYRQLQNVSDAVAPYEEDLVGQHLSDRLDDMQRSEDKFQLAIASSKAKGRYLEHLRKDPKESSPQKCIICMDIFEIGLLTTCGHSFCKDCLRHWWRASHNCPVCKKRLRRNDLYQIT